MSFFYAEPASGPSAGGIGWLDFGDLRLRPGDNGLQTQAIQVHAPPGHVYYCNESMAPDSLPASFTPALGDDLVHTIYNQIPYTYHKGVDKTATLVQSAQLSLRKSADLLIAYLGDTITYQLAVKNTGNISAHEVLLTDALTPGTAYVPGSLVVSVPAAGDPTTEIALANPIAPSETVAISFQVTVAAIPSPNPIQNVASAAFTFGTEAGTPESGSSQSNTVVIPVFRYNFRQPVSDVIHSVAQQQAALAAITNAEGSKMQRIAAMPEVTPEELVCLNESMTDMMDSIAMLEAVVKQKLNILKCQISGEFC